MMSDNKDVVSTGNRLVVKSRRFLLVQLQEVWNGRV